MKNSVIAVLAVVVILLVCEVFKMHSEISAQKDYTEQLSSYAKDMKHAFDHSQKELSKADSLYKKHVPYQDHGFQGSSAYLGDFVYTPKDSTKTMEF